MHQLNQQDRNFSGKTKNYHNEYKSEKIIKLFFFYGEKCHAFLFWYVHNNN